MTSRVYFLSLPPSHSLIGFIGIRKPAIRHLGLSMDECNIIDDVIQHRGEGHNVFCIVCPVECSNHFLLTRLLTSWDTLSYLQKKLKNSRQKDYMGKAKAVN